MKILEMTFSTIWSIRKELGDNAEEWETVMWLLAAAGAILVYAQFPH